MNKITTTVLLFLAVTTASFAQKAPSPTPSPTPTAVVTPTPTPTPVPSITLSDGKPYTGSQIEQAFRQLQQRLQDVTDQRNKLAGDIVDLQATIQKLQQPASTPAPPPSK